MRLPSPIYVYRNRIRAIKVVGRPILEMGSLCLRGRTSPSKFAPRNWYHVRESNPSHQLEGLRIYPEIQRDIFGACTWIRTRDLRLIKTVLLPAELHRQIGQSTQNRTEASTLQRWDDTISSYSV